MSEQIRLISSRQAADIQRHIDEMVRDFTVTAARLQIMIESAARTLGRHAVVTKQDR